MTNIKKSKKSKKEREKQRRKGEHLSLSNEFVQETPKLRLWTRINNTMTQLTLSACDTGSRAISTGIYCTMTPIVWSLSTVAWVSAAPIRLASGVLERLLPEPQMVESLVDNVKVNQLEQRLKSLEKEVQTLKRSITQTSLQPTKQTKLASPPKIEEEIPPPPPMDEEVPPPPPPPLVIFLLLTPQFSPAAKPFTMPTLRSVPKSLETPTSPSTDKMASKADTLKKVPKTPTMGITLADITQVKLRKRVSPKPLSKLPADAPKLNMQLRKVQKSPGGTPMKAAPLPAKTNSIASPLYHAIQTKFKTAYSDENLPPTPNNVSTMNTSWT